MTHFNETLVENNTDLLTLVKIIISKFPNIGKKFIFAGFLNTLKLLFLKNKTLVTSIYYYLIPYMSDQEKEDLHYFIFSHIYN
jgi:hypothetical protein